MFPPRACAAMSRRLTMCFIIPQDVLLRLADDDSVADDSRTALA
ncbi:MAG: M4 family metallopeptidase, partial [Mycobacterium sp.]